MVKRIALLIALTIPIATQSVCANDSYLTLNDARRLVEEDGHGRQPIIWYRTADERATAIAFITKLDDEGYNGNAPALASYSQATFQDRQDFGLDVRLSNSGEQWPRVLVLRKGYRVSATEKRDDVVSFGSFILAENMTVPEFAGAMAACKYDAKSGSYYCSSGYCSSGGMLARARARRENRRARRGK